jgi:Zn-dependent peptidase ImmA (M78 family)
MNVNPTVLENKSVIQDTYLMIDRTLFKVKSRTPKDWMEHHADKYAAFILMPKKFVVKLFKEKHKEYFKGERRLTKYHPNRTWLMIASIAKTLSVSKKAMAYRLRDLGLISEEIFLSLKLDTIKKGGYDNML